MKVSIITVVWNNKETIRDSIDSILSQTYQNIEYIIVDGGSNDGTVDVVKSYGDKIDKFISEADNGIYDALNKGIAISTGDIIGLLHSDDYYPNPNILSIVVEKFKNNDIDMIWGDIIYVNKKGESKRHYSGENINFNIGIMPPHPSVFIKKKCYEDFGYYNTDYRIAADYDLLFRFIKLNNLKCIYSNDIIVNMTPGGASNKNIFSSIKLNKEIYQIHKSHNRPISIFSLFKKIPRRISELIPQ